MAKMNLWGQFHANVMAQLDRSDLWLARTTRVRPSTLSSWKHQDGQLESGPSVEWLETAARILALPAPHAREYVVRGMLLRVRGADAQRWFEDQLSALEQQRMAIDLLEAEVPMLRRRIDDLIRRTPPTLRIIQMRRGA